LVGSKRPKIDLHNHIQDWRGYVQEKRRRSPKVRTISCLKVAPSIVILEFITPLVILPALRRKGFKGINQGRV
jgi:hypothetical protein